MGQGCCNGQPNAVQLPKVITMNLHSISTMATGRALCTETEREYLEGKHGEQRRYEAISRIRSRIEGPLNDDLSYLEEHAPDLAEELRDIVCG